MICSPMQAQEEVSAALQDLGIKHSVGTASNGGLLKPDLKLSLPSGRVALSVDENSRFSINSPYQPLGDAILGWRLLMLHDWKVRTVSTCFYSSNFNYYPLSWRLPL